MVKTAMAHESDLMENIRCSAMQELNYWSQIFGSTIGVNFWGQLLGSNILFLPLNRT